MEKIRQTPARIASGIRLSQAEPMQSIRVSDLHQPQTMAQDQVMALSQAMARDQAQSQMDLRRRTMRGKNDESDHFDMKRN